MKSVKFYAVAAAVVSSLLSLAAWSQGQASFNKSGAGSQATCTYTGLTIINGNLDITCSTDVVYTGTGGGGGGGTTTGPYALTVGITPASSGTVSGPSCTTGSAGGCNGSIASGQATSVTATAATGYSFQSWSGGPCAGSTSATCNWTMTGAVTMSANFQSSSTGGGGGGTVPTGCTGLTPTTNYELKSTLGPSNQSTKHVGTQGVTYAFPLPVNRGLFSTSTTVFTPGSLAVEVGISQCPGDLNYYKTGPASVSLWGILQTPCGGVFGAESGGVNWSTSTGAWSAVCQTPTGTNWYMNIRFLQGTCPTGSCEIYYTWSPS